jgi:hypothetical protein
LTVQRRRRGDARHARAVSVVRTRLKLVGEGADVHHMDTRSSLLVLAGAGLASAVWVAVSAGRRNRQPDAPPDRDLALSEVEHERDVSIARAADAAERERLARERLAALAPLEARVEVAERRAIDAERRLGELTERLTGGPGGAAVSGEGTDGSEAGPAASGRASELRARLTRSAERKRPGREP